MTVERGSGTFATSELWTQITNDNQWVFIRGWLALQNWAATNNSVSIMMPWNKGVTSRDIAYPCGTVMVQNASSNPSNYETAMVRINADKLYIYSHNYTGSITSSTSGYLQFAIFNSWIPVSPV